MEVLLRGHGGDGGATAVHVRCHGGHSGAAATTLRIGPPAVALRKFWKCSKFALCHREGPQFLQFSAVIRRSMTEPLRNHGDHGGATAVYAVQEPQWHRAFGVTGVPTAESRRNMLKVSAVPPRRSAVLTVFRDTTAINDGTTAEQRRSWRCHCGLCRTSTAVAPDLRCDGGRHLLATLTPIYKWKWDNIIMRTYHVRTCRRNHRPNVGVVRVNPIILLPVCHDESS